MKLNNKYGKKFFLLFLFFNFILVSIACLREKSTNQVENKIASSNKIKNTIKNLKSELNGGIFISEKFLKKKNINSAFLSAHKNSKIPTDSKIDSAPTITSATTPKSEETPIITNISSDLGLGKGPIFLEMWVKFFKYSDLDINVQTPTHFFLNNEFFNQHKMFPKNNKFKFIYLFFGGNN